MEVRHSNINHNQQQQHDDGGPKDYSRLYIEERQPPMPSSRSHHNIITNHPTIKHKLGPFQMDGACHPLKHRELDLREVVLKLQDHITQANSHAKDALSQHYTSFVKAKRPKYKVMIEYPKVSNQEDVVYAIRIHVNSLHAVKDKLPRRGNYRYFFKTSSCLEEIESDDAPVPIYAEKDGYKQIFLHLFERY